LIEALKAITDYKCKLKCKWKKNKATDKTVYINKVSEYEDSSALCNKLNASMPVSDKYKTE
jgi:hypothetical protein